MKRVQVSWGSRARFMLWVLAVGAIAGCGAADDAEQDATSEQGEALLPAGCGWGSQPDIELKRASVGLRTASVQSPTLYGTDACPKAWRVDLQPGKLIPTQTTSLRWADPWARNQVQCEGGALKLDVYAPRTAGESVHSPAASAVVPLVWDPTSQRCLYGRIDVRQPTVASLPDLQSPWSLERYQEDGAAAQLLSQQQIPELARAASDHSLRFVVTALTPRGTTQPVTLTSTRND